MKSNAYYAAVTGIMLAAALALNAAENILSAVVPFPVFGMRIGLSNIVIITAAVTLGYSSALTLTVLKSLFVLLTRGFAAGLMSIGGGITAFLLMILLLKRTNSSYVFISVLCAVAHTSGQLAVASVILKSIFSFYYAPVLLIFSIGSGICTGVILNAVVKNLPEKLCQTAVKEADSH